MRGERRRRHRLMVVRRRWSRLFRISRERTSAELNCTRTRARVFAMCQRSVAIVVLLQLAAAACRSSPEPQAAITFVRQGSGGGVTSTRGLARLGQGAQVSFTVAVRNDSDRETRVDEIVAVVINSDGRVETRVLVAPARFVGARTTVTYRHSMKGGQAGDCVLGVAARFDGLGGTSAVCTPFCADCDNVKTQRACEQFDLLLKHDAAGPNIIG